MLRKYIFKLKFLNPESVNRLSYRLSFGRNKSWNAVNKTLPLGVITCAAAIIIYNDRQNKAFAMEEDIWSLFLSELSQEINQAQIDTDQDECQLRGKPWSSYHKLDVYPKVIIYPVCDSYSNEKDFINRSQLSM